MTTYNYADWFAIFATYQVHHITWTWYQQYNDDWACKDEQIVLHNGDHKHITEIPEQELYEAIWDISEATSYDGELQGELGVFRLDIATRTLCKIAEVGDWEVDDYHPDSGPYIPSIHPLPDDQQPCYVIGTG
ncbi:MAG: hypothetical protein AAGF95_05115 [Chloroflexota bacterium]